MPSARSSRPPPSARTARSARLSRALDAVKGMIVCGDVLRAYMTLDDAVHALERLPTSPHARELCLRADVERARLSWYVFGVTSDYTLDSVFELAFEAQDQMDGRSSPLQRADIAAIIAGIACDLDTLGPIERAREAVLDCTLAFLAEGAVTAAESLLVLRAELQVRSGDLRATERIGRAIGIFEDRREESPKDSSPLLYLADARHLLATLPLRGAGWGATSAPAIEVAIDNCRAANATYAEFGRRRELVRVLHTAGMLEAQRGCVGVARGFFERALIIADDIGDSIGLARVTTGLVSLVV